MTDRSGHKLYRLPMGKITRSCREYEQAWRDLGAFMEIIFDGRVLTYDPGVSLACRVPDVEGELVLNLPTWAALRLATRYIHEHASPKEAPDGSALSTVE